MSQECVSFKLSKSQSHHSHIMKEEERSIDDMIPSTHDFTMKTAEKRRRTAK